MGKIAFINNNKSAETEHSINALISFKNHEEYRKLKDWDKQDLSMFM